jgi:hypothetical protein
VRERGRDGDHRQAAQGGGEFRDVEGAAAADPDDRVVEARAQPLGEVIGDLDAAAVLEPPQRGVGQLGP